MSLVIAISCQPRRVLRAAYVDMDGTLLGRGASLFHDAEGAFTLLGARALEACARASVEVVPYSGRRRSTLLHNAVLLGLRSYIYEAGCGMVLDGEVMSLVDDADDAEANALLLAHYAGRLEQYDPWNLGRESSRLYLGRDVSVAEADDLLIEGGFGGWRLVDNGVMHGDPGTGGRAFHLVPRGASKAAAVARHMQARGFAPEDVIAVGDSMEDLGSASAVGTFWLVANAEPEVHHAARGHTNVRVAEGLNGAGVYEAIITELAERR
jgi:hydroxymethylpyrimidine pyrophosphatase-like HAD family hydrolase